MVVVEAHLHYRKALSFDDEFDVRCACTHVGRASFTFSYRLVRAGELCAEGTTRHACVDRAGLRPVRVPAWLAAAVAASD